MNLARRAARESARVLARFGVVDEDRGERIADLAWPRVVTGLARTSQSAADLAMVGLVIGPAAIAGLGFGFAYLVVAASIGFSLANGSMTFMSQRFGARDDSGMDIAIKQAILLEVVVAASIAAVFLVFTEPLIAALGASEASLGHGTVYLRVVSLALVFEAFNYVASRALLSANEAWTPMVIRAAGAVGNIGLNVVFIFGLGMGAFGAALGTVIATVAVSASFAYGFVRGRHPGLGHFPIRLSLRPPYFDATVMAQLVEVSAPLAIRRLLSRFAIVLMLGVVASFGTIVVAAYVVSLEVRRLLNTPTWGFGTAARSLVGQRLGASDEAGAEAYGWDVLRFTAVVYVLLSLVAFGFAREIGSIFSNDPTSISETAQFIRVLAVSLFGLGVDGAVTGTLSAGGDTRWPLYAKLVGLYVFMLPIAYLGVVTPAGVLAVYVAMIAEAYVPLLITLKRFRGGKWKAVSRKYRQSTGPGAIPR